MKKKHKNYEKTDVICYLSVEADLERVTRLEDKQEKYIREYAKAHNYAIVDVVRRNGFGQNDVNRQFNAIASLIRNKRVDGIILVNMMAVSKDIVDAYNKVGLIRAAGGVIVTVDEGCLGMNIKEAV